MAGAVYTNDLLDRIFSPVLHRQVTAFASANKPCFSRIFLAVRRPSTEMSTEMGIMPPGRTERRGAVMAKGRKSSVRYYESKGAYFTHFEGKQIRLADGPDDAPKGKTYLAALARFPELMSVSNADTADQGNTVRVVVDLYGQHLERNGQDRSLEIVLQTCTSAVAQFGDKTFDALKPVHVTGWLALMSKPRDTKKHKGVKWGATYQNMALRTLVAAFNWAKGQGLITHHCLENSKAVTDPRAEAEPRPGSLHLPGDLADAARADRGDQPRLRRHPSVPARDRLPAG